MRHIYQNHFKDGNGRVVSGGTISVYLAGTTTVANVYAASSGGTAVNSVTSGTDGYFKFYVDEVDYAVTQKFKVVLSATNYTTKTYDDINVLFAVLVDGVTRAALQAGSPTYSLDTGVADAYVITPVPALTAYTLGMELRVRITNANLTTTPVLNASSLGTKTIKRENSAALLVADLPVNHEAIFRYNGTDLILLNPALPTTAPHNQAWSTITGEPTTLAGYGITDGLVIGDLKIERGGVILDPAGAVNLIVWRAPYACTVTAIKGYRVGSSGATINARRNGADNHLSSALSLTSNDAWMDGGAVQNTAYVAGDKLEIMLVSIAGAPTQVAIQVEFVRV